MQRYIELSAELRDAELADILTAELSDYPFEGFMQQDDAEGGVRLTACMPLGMWDECRSEVAQLLARYGVAAAERTVEPENWNSRWEKESFEPVAVDGDMIIRGERHAPHPECGIFDIVVAPAMSFGSGHHATTRMMCRAIRSVGTAGRTVLDVGCGTGILSIVAARAGAARVDAIDIDPAAVESCRRSIALSRVEEKVVPIEGTVADAPAGRYDMLLANINRNIIISDMTHYVALLAPGGDMLLSGFLDSDLAMVEECCRRSGIEPASAAHEDQFCMLHCKKR